MDSDKPIWKRLANRNGLLIAVGAALASIGLALVFVPTCGRPGEDIGRATRLGGKPARYDEKAGRWVLTGEKDLTVIKEGGEK